MQRTFDAERIDALAKKLWNIVAQDNQPFRSLASMLCDQRNIALECDAGVFLGLHLEFGTYEVHTLFERGAGRIAKQAARWMFTHTDCVELYTRVPQCNPLAKRLAENAGFRLQFTGREWLSGGVKYPVDFYSYRIEDWILDDDTLPEVGASFHAQLDSLGVEKDHGHDAVHDRYVGAAISMIQGSQVRKGIVYYNRWARFYGAHPITLIHENPVTVDIGTAVLFLRGNELCQLVQD